MMFLRDLKRAVARRKPKVMALVLGEVCNAANVRFRPRPSGLTGLSVLGVMLFRQAHACLQNHALITNKPVIQKYHRIDQRFPGSTTFHDLKIGYLDEKIHSCR